MTRVEHLKASFNTAAYVQQGLNRSFLLDAGARPVIGLIKGAKIVVRHAEKNIAAGPPLKNPRALALVLQLAQHFERIFVYTATPTVDGPFDKFCQDVFSGLGMQTESGSGWEYLLREGLKQHRTYFGARRRPEGSDNPAGERDRPRRQKPMKRVLTPSKRRKN